MKTWQVQEAKAHFSEVIELAHREGPQAITKHGKPRAIVVSVAEYESMKKRKPSLIDYLKSGPSFDGVDLERSEETGREIDLE
jgi:antitoxin Phd